MARWKYFNPEKEPKLVGVDGWLINKLDMAREVAGVPFVVVSGKRSVEENVRVGGASSSAHLSGNAVDISCGNPTALWKMLQGLLHAGVPRIGLNGVVSDGKFIIRGIHADNDPTKPQNVVWIREYDYTK